MLGEFERICVEHPDPSVRRAWEQLRKAATELLHWKIRHAFYTLSERELQHLTRAHHEFKGACEFMKGTCRVSEIADVPDLSPTAFADWLLRY